MLLTIMVVGGVLYSGFQLYKTNVLAGTRVVEWD